MRSDEKDEIILNIFQEAFNQLGETIYDNQYCLEAKETLEDEVSITFYIYKYQKIFLKIFMKKQKTKIENLPTIRDTTILENRINPYILEIDGGQIAKYTDETYILGKIYENIIKYPFKEINCYEKYGILISNPLGLEGIYNINVRFVLKGE